MRQSLESQQEGTMKTLRSAVSSRVLQIGIAVLGIAALVAAAVAPFAAGNG